MFKVAINKKNVAQEMASLVFEKVDCNIYYVKKDRKDLIQESFIEATQVRYYLNSENVVLLTENSVIATFTGY